MIKKIGLSLLCVASAFAMHTVELNINDKDLEIGAKLDMGQFSDATEPDTVFIGGKFLHGDKSHSGFSDIQGMDDYMELNFLMKRDVGNTGIGIGLGVKLNHTKDFTSIPLGAEVAYKIPVSKKIPMSVCGSVYYAPSVLSMDKAKNFLEYRIEFDAEVIANGHVVAGFRNIDTNYDDPVSAPWYLIRGNKNYNKSPYVGFRFAF